jgi:hypothetical protein
MFSFYKYFLFDIKLKIYQIFKLNVIIKLKNSDKFRLYIKKFN